MKKGVYFLFLLCSPLLVKSQSVHFFYGLRNLSGSSVGITIPNSKTDTKDIFRGKLNYLVGVQYKKKQHAFSVGLGYVQSGGSKERTVETAPINPYSISFEQAKGSAQHYNLMLDYLNFFTIEKLRIAYGVELFATLNHKDEYESFFRSSADSVNQTIASGNDFYRRYPNIWTLRPSIKLGTYYPIFKGKVLIGVEVLPGISWQFVNGTYIQKDINYNFSNNSRIESNQERFDKSSQITLGLLGQATIQIKLFDT